MIAPLRWKLLSLVICSLCGMSGCGSSEDASPTGPVSGSGGKPAELEPHSADASAPKLVSPRDVPIDPAERDKWAQNLKTGLAAGDQEVVKDFLARIRNYFGAKSAFDAFVDAGIYESDERMRIWAVGMIDGLMVEQDSAAALVVADALLRFVKDPVRRVQDAALGELENLARNHPEVVAHARPVLLEMFAQEENEKLRRDLAHTFRDLAQVDGWKFTDFSGVDHPLATADVVDALLQATSQPRLLEPSVEALGTICRHDLQLANNLLDRATRQLQSDSVDEQLVAIKVIAAIVNGVEETRSHHQYHKNPPAAATAELEAFREKLPGIQTEFEKLREGNVRELQTEVLFPINGIKATLSRPISR